MPSLTVKAMGELLRLPAFAQARILVDQKYPKQTPQSFRTPYYQSSLTGIRNYFRSGGDEYQLVSARGRISLIDQPAKRLNNLRVIDKFETSKLAKRKLELKTNPTVKVQTGDVELRLSPDLRAIDTEKEFVILVSCRAQKLDPEIAVQTIEIAHWVLEEAGIKIPIANVQFFDLFDDQVHSTKKRRAATTKALAENAKIIETLWPSL